MEAIASLVLDVERYKESVIAEARLLGMGKDNAHFVRFEASRLIEAERALARAEAAREGGR